MRVRKRMALVVSAALVSMALAESASAQMRVGGDGRAADANTRVGSGGYNAAQPNLQLASPNDIALGNVTGARGFRGPINRDPSQPFGGRSNMSFDRFYRSSNPAVTPASPYVPQSNAVPFYSTTSIGNPPTGYVINPYTGQSVQVRTPVPGDPDYSPYATPGTSVMRPDGDSGGLYLPLTARDANGAAAPLILTASPLLGVRPMNEISDQDRYMLARTLAAGGDIDLATLQKLRTELRQTMQGDARLAEQLRQAEAQAQAGLAARNPLAAKARVDMTASGSTPIEGAVQPPPLTGARPYGAPDITPKSTEESAIDRNPLMSELHKRDADLKKNGKKDGAEPKPAAPSTQQAQGVAPQTELRPEMAKPVPKDVPENPGPASTGYIKPLKVDSLAAHQSQAGVKQLLTGAEKMMAAGKYGSAIERYALAAKYASKDPTMLVGRSHAELGAGFFARAESSLREAVTMDGAVLGAQYDLRKSIGEQRVTQLISDLKKIALDDKKSAMPLTMLAYIAYNAGQEERAAELLKEAQLRAPDDELIKALTSHWGGNK